MDLDSNSLRDYKENIPVFISIVVQVLNHDCIGEKLVSQSIKTMHDISSSQDSDRRQKSPSQFLSKLIAEVISHFFILYIDILILVHFSPWLAPH